jgi:hypothetical protein
MPQNHFGPDESNLHLSLYLRTDVCPSGESLQTVTLTAAFLTGCYSSWTAYATTCGQNPGTVRLKADLYFLSFVGVFL